MLEVKIYQTLEDRGNDEEIESHGPYKCLSHTGNGLLKKGVKEPWLGEGYYFWDTRMVGECGLFTYRICCVPDHL